MLEFGKYLRLCREKRNLRLTDTAKIIGVSVSYLSSLESGKRTSPSFEVLERIAEVLNLSEKERYTLYDLAAESKEAPKLAEDLTLYIYRIPRLRDTLRSSMEYGLDENEWDSIINYIKEFLK